MASRGHKNSAASEALPFGHIPRSLETTISVLCDTPAATSDAVETAFRRLAH